MRWQRGSVAAASAEGRARNGCTGPAAPRSPTCRAAGRWPTPRCWPPSAG